MSATGMDIHRRGKPSRVLVTGGAGFIGSHLCDRLLSVGCDVFCLDNFFTGSRNNVAHLIGHPRFRLIEHDVTEPFYLEVDRIFNLACPASPAHYQTDPIQTTRTSVLGALNMLELARQNNAVIVQSSTSEIYGDPLIHPQPESYWGNVNPTGPRSCYDEGKRCAESLFFDYHRHYHVQVKVARLFNTYGPYMQPNDGRVVSNLLMQALQNKPLTIFGNGGQTRSFCFVTDMVEALIRLSDSRPEFVGPVNLGNPEELTILELVELVRDMTHSCSRITYRALPQDDPRQRRPDITLANTELGWFPTTPVREGLRRTALYFEAQLQQGVANFEAAFENSTRPGHILLTSEFARKKTDGLSQDSEASAFSVLSEKPRSGPH